MSESQTKDEVTTDKEPSTTDTVDSGSGVDASSTAESSVGASGVTVIEKQVQRRIFKIIVIGDSNVGKTCLTYRFCSGQFPDRTEATIGVDFRERTVDVDKEQIKLQLWDTAGQERFRKSMVQHYYRNVHAVVFVYDVTKLSSFDNMPQWIEECDHHNLNKSIPRVLVGNKCDMRDRAVVSINLAQKFADMHNMPLFETSAKDDTKADHVEAIFMTLAHKLKNSKPMMPIYLSNIGQSTNISGQPRPILIGQYNDTHGHGSAVSQERGDSCAC